MGPFERFLITRGVLYSLGATAVLSVTGVFTQSQRLVEAVTNNGMPLETFSLLLIALLPWMADGALVIGSVVGVLFLMLSARGTRELLIQQALGQSPVRRFVPFLVMFVVLASVQLILSMLVAPPSYTYHRDLRKNYSSEVKLGDALSAGVTTELTPATSLYLHERIDGQNFRGVHLYDETVPGQEISTFANRAAVYSDANGFTVILFEGYQVNEGGGGAVPTLTTFSALPFVFDRNTSGLAIGRVAVSTAGQPDIVKRGPFRPDLLPSLSFFRGDREIKIGDLSPTEIPPDLGYLTAVYVLKNLNSDEDFRVQHIRVPSNEFHRRIATVVLLFTSIWLIFSYMGTDFHLRRPPVWGYVVIGCVVTLSLLLSRFAMESIAYDPKKFWWIYAGAVMPVPFIVGKILLGFRR